MKHTRYEHRHYLKTHETEHGTIYCGDSVDVLKDMADDSVDCCITSPPYDNLRNYKGYIFDFEGIAN